LKLWAGSALAIFVLGCGGTKAVIIDAGSLQTSLSNVRLANGGHRILVLEGESERRIPLKKIRWIKISPREVRNRNGHTFYLTEIELRDGAKLMSYRLKDGRRSQVFVCVEDVIMARTPNGTLRLDLSRVSKVTFE